MLRKRVLLADDHPVVRLGIRRLLEKDLDFVVAGEASSGEEALRLVEELSPDILLLDIEMPGLSGIDVARRLCEAESPVRILVISAHDEKFLVKELMAAGVNGYLTKDDAPESIIDAVRGVARGERGWINRRVAAQMSAAIQEDGEKIKDLTASEVLVLKAVVDGMTNIEIGYAQHISEKTVEKHLAKIFVKLGVASRLEAAVHAIRQSLV